MKTKTEHQKGVIALIILAFVFASMGLFARYLSTDFSLFQQVYIRILSAFFLGLIFFRKNLNFKKLRKISKKEWALLFFRSSLIYLFAVTLFTKAIIIAKYSNVSFIGALPFVAILGTVLLKEKLTFKKLLFIITAFLGVILVAVKDYSYLLSWGEGEFVALLATIGFSLSYISRKWHSKLLNNQEITQIIFFLAFFIVFTTSLVIGEGLPVVNLNINLFAIITGAGLFNVINIFLANYGFQKVEAILANNIITLESLFAVILAIIFYKEFPTIKELLGGIFIVLSAIGMNKVEAIE